MTNFVHHLAVNKDFNLDFPSHSLYTNTTLKHSTVI